MADISRTTTIHRPPDQVWAALVDFGAIGDWAPNVDHSTVSHHGGDGEAGAVGTVRRVQAGRMALLETIVTADEPERLAYDITGLPKVVRSAVNAWTLRPVGDRATEVTLTSTVDCGPRPPQQLVARIVSRVMARQSDAMLGGLKQHLEV